MKKIGIVFLLLLSFSANLFSQDFDVEMIKGESKNWQDSIEVGELLVIKNLKSGQIIDTIMFFGPYSLSSGELIQTCLKNNKNMGVLLRRKGPITTFFEFFWFQKKKGNWNIDGGASYGMPVGMMSSDQIETWEAGGKWIHPYNCNILAPHLLDVIYKNKFGTDVIESIDFSTPKYQDRLLKVRGLD